LRKDGAAVAGSVAEACGGDTVLTMLADDAALEAVVFGEGGVVESVAARGVHASLSTISVALSESLGDGARAGRARTLSQRLYFAAQRPPRRQS